MYVDIIYSLQILHGIGLYHTHTRRDRDQYITINSTNIAASRKNEFDVCESNCQTYGTPYDCDSVMHYASNQMAADKDKATISENDLYFIIEGN